MYKDELEEHLESLPVWESTDYYLCSFLIARGMKVVNVVPDDPSKPRPRMTFILHDPEPEQRKEYMLQYKLQEDEVSAHEFVTAMKTLQKMMREVSDKRRS